MSHLRRELGERRTRFDPSQLNEDTDHEALPEAEEDDTLDAEELGHRAERLEVVVRSDPKHRKACVA